MPGRWRSTTTSIAELREACEDVVLNRRPDAAERLLALAQRYRGQGKERRRPISPGANGRSSERLSHALVHGITDFIEPMTSRRRDAAPNGRCT